MKIPRSLVCWCVMLGVTATSLAVEEPVNELVQLVVNLLGEEDKDIRALAGRLNEARIVVSARRNVLRFSPHLYNDADDIRQALAAIDRCLT